MEKILAAMGAAVVLAASPARAADNDSTNPHKGFYLGAALGDFSSRIDNFRDIDADDLDFDADDDAHRVFAGWRFNRFLAFNVDYTDFGRSSAATNLLNVTSDTKGLTPGVVGTLPLGPVELFAKAGMVFYDVRINANGNNVVDDSGHDPVFGAGIGFTVAKRLNLSAEYERIEISDFDDANAVWLSASWRF